MSSGSVSGNGSFGSSNVELISGSPSAAEQRLGDRVIGHANADRAAFRVLQTLRQLVRRAQHEGVGPRSQRLQQAIGPILHARVRRNVGEVATREREIVVSFDAA